VKPAAFEYFRPASLDEALAMLAAHGSDAKPLAGGQSLIPAMNFRLATPAVLVDLNAITSCAFIRHPGDATGNAAEGNAPWSTAPVRIGAMTRQRDIERSSIIATRAPLVTSAMPFVAHPAIRSRGTLGGSLAHADPAAELPAVMLALNAQFTLTNARGSRVVTADDFFVGLFATAIEPGELLTEVAIPPMAPHVTFAFRELSRRHGDFALAGVAAVITTDARGRCADARIALFSVGERPTLATHAAQVLTGQIPSPDLLRAAAEAAATADIDPPSDIHASSRYRRQLIRVLTRRALHEATGALPQ
jgi:CO/xanthine dehydrogenase FAD-binding subunit